MGLSMNIEHSILNEMALSIRRKATTSLKSAPEDLELHMKNSTIQHVNAHFTNIKVSNCDFINLPKLSSAVFVAINSSVQIEDSIFENVIVDQLAKQPAILYALQSEINVQASKFTSNAAMLSNILAVTSNVTVNRCIFSRNYGIGGAAIDVQTLSHLTVVGCNFMNNKASFGSAIAALVGSHVGLFDSTFDMNQGAQGAVINIQGQTEDTLLHVSNCSFSNNQANEVSFNWMLNMPTLIGIFKKSYTTDRLDSVMQNVQLAFPNIKMQTTSEGMLEQMALDGGVIMARNKTVVSIDNSAFKNNSAGGQGGVIHVDYDSVLTLKRSVLEKNSASQGGVINAQYNVKVTLLNITAIRNAADDIGAVHAQKNQVKSKVKATLDAIESHQVMGGVLNAGYNATVLVSYSTFSQNMAQYAGGVLVLFPSVTVDIAHSHFEANSAVQGGVLNAQYAVNITVRNTSFLNNSASAASAVFVGIFNVQIKMHECILAGNSATKMTVFGVQNHTSLVVRKSKFLDNTAKTSAGVLSADKKCNIQMNNCTFSGNSASGQSSILDINNSTVSVSGSMLSSGISNLITANIGSQLSLDTCDISYNGQTDGKALMVVNEPPLIGITMSSDFQMHSCRLHSNDYQNGVLISADLSSTLNISQSNFTSNVFKGAFDLDSVTLTMDRSTMKDNYATADVSGGIIHMSESSIKITRSHLLNNSANGDGACLYCKSGQVSIWDSFFQNNSASGIGGTIYFNGGSNSSLETVNSSFLGNHAGQFGAAIYVQHDVDVVLDLCHFEDNLASSDSGVYMIDIKSLRISESKFIKTNKNSMKASLYFVKILKHLQSNLKTLETAFASGSDTLNSSDKNFLKKAKAKGYIFFYNDETQSYVSHLETPYASGTTDISLYLVKPCVSAGCNILTLCVFLSLRVRVTSLSQTDCWWSWKRSS